MSPAEDEKLEAEETGWHMWMAENIGELLAVAPTLPVLPRRERITYAMAVCVEEAARGTESVLAQALGLRPAGAWEWLHTERTPRLDLLLRLCDLVGISLLDFLTAEDIHVGPLRTNRPWMKFSPQQRSSRRPFDGEGVRQALEEILVSEEQPPPSLCEVARRLDRQVSVLAVRFPDLCHAISARYMAYRTVRSKERIQQVCVEVRQAVLAVHAQGVYPSLTRVAGLLRAPRLIQIPEAQATWRETLQELGR